jgi:flavin reductase
MDQAGDRRLDLPQLKMGPRCQVDPDIGGADRFRNTPWREGVTGAPLLNTAICAIDCVLQQHHLVGSHGIFIGRMVATRQLCASSPVINFQGELRTLPLA